MSKQLEDRLEQMEQSAGIEMHGIDRVLPDKRTHVRIFDNFTLWASANMVLSTLALGSLATTIFKLGVWDSVSVIVLFNILGILPVAFFSTLGPKLGLRQMTISRFSFGWLGAKIMALFNVAACIGWSTVNVIVGGQLVSLLTGNAVPGLGGHSPDCSADNLCQPLRLRLCASSMSDTPGYRCCLCLRAMLFVSAPHFSAVTTEATGWIKFASLMSFGSTIYGFATGWSAYASDYNVNQPETTNPKARVLADLSGMLYPAGTARNAGRCLDHRSSTERQNGRRTIWGGAQSTGWVW